MEDIWIIISTLFNQRVTLGPLSGHMERLIYDLYLYLHINLARSLSRPLFSLLSYLSQLSVSLSSLPYQNPSRSSSQSYLSCSPSLRLREEEEGICLGEEPPLPHSDAGSANRNCKYLFLSGSPQLL